MNVELWKERKKSLKLTFEELSTTTGLSVRTLKSLFSGERTNTTTFTVQAIEKALGISEEQPTFNVSPKKKEIIDLMMQLDDETLNDIMTVVKLMVKK